MPLHWPAVTGSDTEARNRLRIAAGVLHYRYWPEVRTTIDSLLAQTRQPDEILLMDHASGDGSADQMREAYPDLELIELTENRGPSVGENRMVEELLARDVDAVFILVDDIELAPDALEVLAARMEDDPSLGAVGPLVAHVREPELIFYAGGHIDPRTFDVKFLADPPRLADWKGQPPREVDFLETGGLLLRASAGKAAGPMPEHFHYLYDDIDQTLRVGRLGWRLECVPAAVIWQDLGDHDRDTLMTEMPPYLAVRNRLGLVARNAPRRMLARELLRIVSWLVRDAIKPRDGSRASLGPRVRGLVDFLRGRWGPAPPGLGGKSEKWA